MIHVVIDGKKMTDRDTSIQYLKGKLDLNYIEGNNLDALFDGLNEKQFTDVMQIEIINEADIHRNLQEYGNQIMRMLKLRAATHPAFQLKF